MDNYFYKYTDARGAKKILENLQLLYKSPKKFNDPFDCKIGLRLDIDYKKFVPLFIKKLHQLLFSRRRPELLESSVRKDKILEMWENGSDEEKIQWLEKLRESWEKKTSEVNERYIHDVMCNYRVFCVSKIPDQLLMWAHYADEHKGAVIKLSMPENPLGCWRFKEVTYSDEFPIHCTTDQWVDNMLGLWRPNPEETAEKLLFTKSDHWQYECEWRDITKLETLDNFRDGEHCFEIEKERILAVYFGLEMKNKDREEIMEIRKEKLPHLEVYLTEKDRNKFKLNFKRLDEPTIPPNERRVKGG
jgi:hypothetical protein